MQIILTAITKSMWTALNRVCGGVAGATVYQGSIFDLETDAYVSPGNSFGFMDGGIDAEYTRHFGSDTETRVKRLIEEKYHGELPVGAADKIPALYKNRRVHMIVAPTMRVPMKLEPTSANPYLAARAALLVAIQDPTIKSVAFPAMGTGVGQISEVSWAFQMRQALLDVGVPGYRKSFTHWRKAKNNHDCMTGIIKTPLFESTEQEVIEGR